MTILHALHASSPNALFAWTCLNKSHIYDALNNQGLINIEPILRAAVSLGLITGR